MKLGDIPTRIEKKKKHENIKRTDTNVPLNKRICINRQQHSLKINKAVKRIAQLQCLMQTCRSPSRYQRETQARERLRGYYINLAKTKWIRIP